jgi:hypothetical protein
MQAMIQRLDSDLVLGKLPSLATKRQVREIYCETYKPQNLPFTVDSSDPVGCSDGDLNQAKRRTRSDMSTVLRFTTKSAFTPSTNQQITR